jgi:hypothetical protein
LSSLLPESVGNLGALQTLELSRCDALAALPKSVGNLGTLQTPNLYYCTRLTALPESVGNLGGAPCSLVSCHGASVASSPRPSR